MHEKELQVFQLLDETMRTYQSHVSEDTGNVMKVFTIFFYKSKGQKGHM